MSQAKQHSTIHSSDIADVAADAVKRAVEARQQAGIELSGDLRTHGVHSPGHRRHAHGLQHPHR